MTDNEAKKRGMTKKELDETLKQHRKDDKVNGMMIAGIGITMFVAITLVFTFLLHNLWNALLVPAGLGEMTMSNAYIISVIAVLFMVFNHSHKHD